MPLNINSETLTTACRDRIHVVKLTMFEMSYDDNTFFPRGGQYDHFEIAEKLDTDD